MWLGPRQTDRQDRQRSYSIGRTVLQTVAQKWFALCYQTAVCLSVLFVCLYVMLLYCGQIVGWIKMKLGTQVGLSPGHIVLDGDPAPLPQKVKNSNFRPISVVTQWLHGSRCYVLGMEINLSPGDLVLDGDHVPPPQKEGGAPRFSAHVYCGQTAGWIKMALGMEVSLSPGDFLLDTGPSPSPKMGRSPQFSAHVYCGQTAAWIKNSRCHLVRR